MQKLRKNDPVQIIAGKYRGTVSVILEINGDSAVVEGVNLYKRAKKGEGYKDVTKPINISNLAYYSASHKASSRVSIVVDPVTGKKQRKLTKFDELIK